MKIIIHKLSFLASIVFIIITFNFFSFYQSNYLHLIFILFALLVFPGALLLLSLKPIVTHTGWFISIAVGLSVSLIIFLSLAINSLLPLFNISQPLSHLYLFIGFNILVGILSIISLLRFKPIIIILPKIVSLQNFILLLVTITLPLLSIAGTVVLNNGGSNVLTFLMLAFDILVILFVTIFVKNKTQTFYTWIIYVLGVSVLLMLSMRSWHISGFDISKEYQVFHFTKNSLYWNIFQTYQLNNFPWLLSPHFYNTNRNTPLFSRYFSLL